MLLSECQCTIMYDTQKVKNESLQSPVCPQTSSGGNAQPLLPTVCSLCTRLTGSFSVFPICSGLSISRPLLMMFLPMGLLVSFSLVFKVKLKSTSSLPRADPAPRTGYSLLFLYLSSSHPFLSSIIIIYIDLLKLTTELLEEGTINVGIDLMAQQLVFCQTWSKQAENVF